MHSLFSMRVFKGKNVLYAHVFVLSFCFVCCRTSSGHWGKTAASPYCQSNIPFLLCFSYFAVLLDCHFLSLLLEKQTAIINVISSTCYPDTPATAPPDCLLLSYTCAYTWSDHGAAASWSDSPRPHQFDCIFTSPSCFSCPAFSDQLPRFNLLWSYTLVGQVCNVRRLLFDQNKTELM